ncbi:formimidoylglutamase [Halomonadaceae bacterium KBTZ08]
MPTERPFDAALWQGRTDPEPDSDRWHQRIQPLEANSAPGTALLGFETDAGVARNKGRTGAAQGPDAIRQALAPLAWHRDAPVYDGGNLACEGDELETAQNAMATRVAGTLDAGHQPVVLGGGHEIAYASWSGLAQHLEGSEQPPRVGIINLDAHFDLRNPDHGHSSGTPFAQMARDCQSRGWSFQYACLGVSRASNTRALFDQAQALNVQIHEDRAFQGANMERILRELERFIVQCRHLYLSIDLDVLPAAEAPGVSAPAARGVPLAMLEPIIDRVRDSGRLRVADIAELNPAFDIDQRTARIAARLVHQLTLTGDAAGH